MADIRQKKLFRLQAQELSCKRKAKAFGLAENNYRGRDRRSRILLGILGLVIGVASATNYNRVDNCGDSTNRFLILLVLALGFLQGVLSLFTTVNDYSGKETKSHAAAGKYHEKCIEIGFFFTEDISDIEMVKAFADKTNDSIVELDDHAPNLEAKFAKKAAKIIKRENKQFPQQPKIELLEVKTDK